jgi:hypothetical protein
MGQPTTIFRKHPRRLIFFFVLGIIFIVQGLATAGFFLLSDDTEDVRYAGVGLALFLALVGVWFAGHAWRRISDPADPVVVGPAGLHDRSISIRPIAWKDIRNLHVHATPRSGSILAFDLADGAGDRAGVNRRARLAVRVNRPFGYSYYVHRMGTDADVESLVAAIAPYAEVTTG